MAMQPFQDPDFCDLPSEDLTCIDLVVSQYESDRRRGVACDVEAYLDRSPTRLRSILQKELIRVEAEILVDWGDTASLERLKARWPAYVDLILSPGTGKISSSADAADSTASASTQTESSLVTEVADQSQSVRNSTKSWVEPFTQRFAIQSELAEGGLGQLYVAHDLELERDVAIKVLKRRFLDRPEMMSRFHAEATVTSHLEHPNIIPVYARGHRPCGQPYFAMRLIRGQSLKELITESYQRALSNGHAVSQTMAKKTPAIGSGCLNFRSDAAARDLLLRLITVCRAVAYAHARGFVHRDLKPSNIMVGPFGETVIIDWGLAVSLADADRATAGTVGYMSPEQSKGLHQANQPPADIYSLGCILYCILTNRQPESATVLSIRAGSGADVLRDAPAVLHPAQDQIGVPAELNAICQKATAKSAEDRYATADQLASDLEAWLADEPTTVVFESRLQKLRRRMRSNPGATGAALGTVAATIAALILLLAVMTRGNALLKSANVRERMQTDVARQAMQIAQQHAARSEQAHGRVMELLRTFLVDVEQELTKVPGSSSVRRQVLTTALNQMSQVVEQFDDDAASAENQALANMSIGNLFLRFGKQDLPLDLQLREKQLQNPSDAAEYFFNQARQISEAGLHRTPASDAVLARRLTMLKCQAVQRCVEVALMKGDLPKASHLAEEALALSEQLRSVQGADGESEVSRGLLNWWAAVELCARTWKVTGQVERPRTLLQSAVDALTAELEQHSQNEVVQRALATAHVHLGDIAFHARDLTLAASHYSADIELARLAYNRHPEQMACRRDLAVSLDRLGNLQQRQGDVEKAIESYDAARSLRQSLYEDDKLDQTLVQEMYVSHMKLGDAHMLIRHIDEAAAQYESASLLAEEMVAFDGNSLIARRYQSMCAEVLADVSIARERLDDALRYAQSSLDASLVILERQPASVESARDVMLGHLKVAKVYQAMARWEQTIEQVNIAMEVADRAKANAGSATDPIFVRMKLAEILLLASKPDDARVLCQTFLPQIGALVEASPQDSVWRRRHYQAYNLLAEAESKLEQWAQARVAYHTALDIARAMIADGQRVETVRADVASIEKLLSELK